MTDRGLIARLREADDLGDSGLSMVLCAHAADRIEELVKERDYTDGTNDTLIALNQALEAKLTECEARLGKALEERDEYKAAAEICGKAARAMLAELENEQ